MKNAKLVIPVLFLAATLQAQTADFTYQLSGTSICTPAILQFTPKTTGSPTAFTWTAEGTTYTDNSPLITFKQAGTYTIILAVQYSDKLVSVSKDITIKPGFTATLVPDRAFICKSGPIQFTAYANTAISQYQWDFGDSTIPVKTSAASLAYVYNDSGNYTPQVLLTAANGCTAVASAGVAFKTITITGTSSARAGCTPITVRFNATAVIPSKSSVAGYAWNFNDGSPVVNTTVSTTSKAVSSDGYFDPVVTVTTSEGCVATYNFPRHGFGKKPATVIPTVNLKSECAGTPFVFSNPKTNATDYSWFFGTSSSVRTTDTFALYAFSKLGPQTIRFYPTNYGCYGASQTFTVNVIGLVANFGASNSCSDKKTFLFTDTSQGNVSRRLWTFTNRIAADSTPAVTRSFPKSGAYNVRLDVYDSATGCSSSKLKTVSITSPQLSIAANTNSICKGSLATFKASTGSNVKPLLYDWNLLGKIIAGDTASQMQAKADSNGNFRNYVIMSYADTYCADTAWLSTDIAVKGPVLLADVPASVCLKDSVRITNRSMPYLSADSITSTLWNFGDGSPGVQAFTPPPHVYSQSGAYTLSMQATDKNNCVDSLLFRLYVSTSPFVKLLTRSDTVCLGNTSTVLFQTNDTVSWTPTSIISKINGDTAFVKPIQSGWLYASTGGGYCLQKDSIQMVVIQPFKASISRQSVSLCAGEKVQVTVSPGGKKIAWSPATGLSSANSYSPVILPRQNTSYTIAVADSANCFKDTVALPVIVNPLPTVNAGPDQQLKAGEPFYLQPVYSSNVAQYKWTPSGSLSCGDCAFPKGMAVGNIQYLIQVRSDSGCVAQDTVGLTVECSAASMLMATAFTPNNDGLNDTYRPLVQGVKSIVRFAVYNRFGQMVYEAKNFLPGDPAVGWNGKFKSIDQPASSFYYTLDAICPKGETIQAKGSFLLLR